MFSELGLILNYSRHPPNDSRRRRRSSSSTMLGWTCYDCVRPHPGSSSRAAPGQAQASGPSSVVATHAHFVFSASKLL